MTNETKKEYNIFCFVSIEVSIIQKSMTTIIVFHERWEESSNKRKET